MRFCSHCVFVRYTGMMGNARVFWGSGLVIATLLAGAIGACGSDESGDGNGNNGDPNADGGPGTPGFNNDPDASNNASSAFDVQPNTPQTITVPLGAKTPTITFTAIGPGGQPIKVGWDADRGEIGAVAPGPETSTIFTPTGRTGGTVEISARLGDRTVKRQVIVKIASEQDGPTASQSNQVATTVASLTEGGGIGGVGGEGLGVAVTDPATKTALGAPASNGTAENLTFLYPYNDTVFPRATLAPLVMWRWTTDDADAIRMTVETTSGSFSWTGTFGRPTILTTTGGKFVRHPIPQDVWKAATDTAGGLLPDGKPDRVIVKLTVARNGQAYGPITQSYTIAPGRLSGIVYYNSYGTRLAKNFGGAVGGDGQFGGATLGIRNGETQPALVAGGNGNSSQCRVCHSVAANGSRLVTGRTSESASTAYDLTPTSATPNDMTITSIYPGLTPDGALALNTNATVLAPPTSATAQNTVNAPATNLGTPAFSQDGKLVAFNPINTITNAKQKLFVSTFDAATLTFGTPALVADYTGQPAETRPGWPAFLPDSKSLVFHRQTAAGSDGNNLSDLHTRKGARAQIHWTDAVDATKVTPLDKMNGVGYLPTLPGATSMNCTADGVQVGGTDPTHADDVNFNYEPTVNPAPSGGYVWVVFTSRRMYGNLATIPPFCSDPRGVNLVTNITTKKLWVAAIDLSAKPGTDASHPGFYLPAQELLAGNTRGFWVLDPCKQENSGCESGDECCGGYCKPNASGALVCTNQAPSCAGVGDKCSVAADCCDPTNSCIGGFCRQSGPR